MKNFIVMNALVFFASLAQANPSHLIVGDATEGLLARIETTLSDRSEGAVATSILWNYEVAQASDEDKSLSGLLQQSTKADYLVSCASNSVALSRWTMFGDADGSGPVLWQDAVDGQPEFRQPTRSAERALIKLACESSVAQR